jgi:hypothetical protein
MATYSSSPKLKAAYKTCRGPYLGFGPAGVKPKRLKVTAFFSKRRNPWQLRVMLRVVG